MTDRVRTVVLAARHSDAVNTGKDLRWWREHLARIDDALTGLAASDFANRPVWQQALGEAVEAMGPHRFPAFRRAVTAPAGHEGMPFINAARDHLRSLQQLVQIVESYAKVTGRER